MGKFDWESSEQDIIRMHMRANSETGEINEDGGNYPLPYRYHTLQRPNPKNRWTSNVHRTVFRFYGDIRTRTTYLNSGVEITDLITDGVLSRRQLMLEIWNDIADIDVSSMPAYLRQVPVKDFGPLSKALGIMRGGKPDPKMADTPTGRKRYSVHFGIKPKPFYWIAAHVTQYIQKEEDGKLVTDEQGNPVFEVMAGPKILLLKDWMIAPLAEKVQGWRDVHGDDWSVSGYPIHMVNKRKEIETETELMVRPAGIFDPADKIVYNMSEQPPIDFTAQAEAQLQALDEWLVEKGTPIKDFPFVGAHDEDGWWSEKPMAVLQREKMNGGGSKELGGFDEFMPAKDQAMSKWANHTDEDLVELLNEYGVKMPAKGRTRAKMIAALDRAQTVV